ncbi:MAG: competence protein ComEC [Polaribacter sp.]|jgi:competence protein ComEC
MGIKVLIAAFLAAFLAAIYVVTAAANPVLYMVNVNAVGHKHGDAYLYLDRGEVAMVDVANYKSAKNILIPFMKKLGIDKVDKLFITHPHDDHTGGLDALREAGIEILELYHNPIPLHVSDWNYIPYPVSEMIKKGIPFSPTSYKRIPYYPILERLKSTGTKIIALSRGDVVGHGDSQFDVIYAEKEDNFNGGRIIVNDYSLVLTLTSRGVRTLFTGDMEETLAIRLPSHLDLKADVVHMQHHGGYNVGDLDFYDKVNASVHLYSSTKQIYDSISSTARNITKTLKAELCHSGIHGTVKLTFLNNSFTIQSESGRCSKTVLSKKYGGVIHLNLTAPLKNNAAHMAAIFAL